MRNSRFEYYSMCTFVNLSFEPSMLNILRVKITLVRMNFSGLDSCLFSSSSFHLRDIRVSRHKFSTRAYWKNLEMVRERRMEFEAFHKLGVSKLVHFARLSFKFYFDEFLKIGFRYIADQKEDRLIARSRAICEVLHKIRKHFRSRGLR